MIRRFFSSITKYPNILNYTFNTLKSNDISFFKSLIGPQYVITDQDILRSHNIDYMNKYSGNSKLLLKPSSTHEISQILKYCNSRLLPIVPQSGNTGLVGGSVPYNDEIILSLSRLNSVIKLDEDSGILTCDSGFILQNLEEYLNNKDYCMPLDLGAKGSCLIGGNIATNAGGLRVVKYGGLHANVLGLEVVLADGTVLSNLSGLQKDNTGYHLDHIFIGSEGTLGIITKCSMIVYRKPISVNCAYLAVDSFKNLLKLLKMAKIKLNDILSAIEFQDENAFQCVLNNICDCKSPFDNVSSNYYLLLETSGTNNEHDYQKLSDFLEEGFKNDLIIDGVISQNRSQNIELFKLREECTAACAMVGPVYKYDLSFPINKMEGFIQNVKEYVGERAHVYAYGHLGDGNLHINIVQKDSKKYDSEFVNLIEPWIFHSTVSFGGCISAEHGIGRSKNRYLTLSLKSAESFKIMKKFKNLLDPHNILNPNKIFYNNNINNK